jgi:predicted N-acetyltransferase YhbS
MDAADNITIEYRFDSSLGIMGTDRYVNAYEVAIYSEDHLHDPIKRMLIGKAELSLVLLTLIREQQVAYYSVFDNTQFLSELGETIFDYDINNLREPFLGEEGSNSSNLLVINRLEVLPKWRKKSIGKRVIKDIIWRFSGCFGLVILKAFPLQQEFQYANDQKSTWDKEMKMTDFSQDEAFSTYKIFAYYQSLGFSQFEHTDYFYMNTAYINDKFEAIELEESW